MKRNRDISWYSDLPQFKLAGISNVLSTPPGEGLYTFPEGDEIVDFLYEDRGDKSDILMVCFSSAISAEATVPKLEGRGLAEKLGVSLLAFADPSVAVSDKISTNYCLGKKNHDFFGTMREIILHFMREKRVLFFGVSGGGFPALKFGDYFPDSLSVVINPRVNILVGKTFFRNNKRLLFPNLTYNQIDSQKPLTNGRSKNHVLYIQNIGDENYFGFQMASYLALNEQNPKLSVILGDWGRGHKAMPGDQRLKTLHTIIKSPDWEIGLKTVGVKVASLRELQTYRADLEEAAGKGVPVNDLKILPGTTTKRNLPARQHAPNHMSPTSPTERGSEISTTVHSSQINMRNEGRPNERKAAKLIIGSTKFSVFTPNSVAWKASNGSRFSTVSEYRDYLFSNDRLTQRCEIFINLSLPQLAIASEDVNYRHIVSYSDSLPLKFKELLLEAAETYPFLILDEVMEGQTVMDPHDLARTIMSEPGVFGLFRLDDDDILGIDYFKQVEGFISDAFVGMRVSLPSGFTGIWHNGELSVLREVHRPMIAIGLLSVCKLHADGQVEAPEPTPHNFSDLSAPVILDGRQAAYIWLRHPSQDTELNRSEKADPIKRLKRELVKFESVKSIDAFADIFPAVIPYVCIPKEVLLQESSVSLDTIQEFQFPRLLNTFELFFNLNVRSGAIPRNALLMFDLVDHGGEPWREGVNAPNISLSPNEQIGYFRAIPTRKGRRSLSEMIVLPEKVFCRGIKLMKYKKMDSMISLDRLSYREF